MRAFWGLSKKGRLQNDIQCTWGFLFCIFFLQSLFGIPVWIERVVTLGLVLALGVNGGGGFKGSPTRGVLRATAGRMLAFSALYYYDDILGDLAR